jgi:hypothetical protein
MSRKYLNCPTCGGLCFYPSKNWEDANIKISSMTHTEVERELNYALNTVSYLEKLLEAKDKQDILDTLTIDDLWRALQDKARGFKLFKYSDLFRKE